MSTTTASKLGRLLEKRIELRFKVHPESTLEIINENTLVSAYGECCFGIDHFFRCGSKQIHVQEKWTSDAPKLRDLRHFVVASQALQTKLPLLETPLRIFLSKRRIEAPESLFVLQTTSTESLADYKDIETAIEALYVRVCNYFNLECKSMTQELLNEAATLEADFVQETHHQPQHRLETEIVNALQHFTKNIAPPLVTVMYGPIVAPDIIKHIDELGKYALINHIIRFFKSRRATPLEYDTWITVLRTLRPIQSMMEQVNAETGRRIYTRNQIGEPALQPTEQEQIIEKSRLHNIYKKRTIINVIKDPSH